MYVLFDLSQICIDRQISGLSAMFGILAAISSHLVARCKVLFLYLLVSNSAPIVRAQDKGARIFGVGCLVLLLGY